MTALRATFVRSIYRPDAVLAAAEAFADLARIAVDVGDEVVQVELADPDPDHADVLLDEFCNHALWETVQRSRREASSS